MQKTLVVCFVAICFCMTLPAFSQVSGKITQYNGIKDDSAKVALRNFDPRQINAYRTQQDFQYEEKLGVDTSWWDRFWHWFWGLMDGTLKNKYAGGFIKYLLIVIVTALVIFVVVKFVGLDLKLFASKSKAVDVPYEESMENIHEINFNDEIEKAADNGSYRLAVRLLYLRSLKLLSDKGLINWQPEKTNQAYTDELTDPERKQQFKLLTLQFEYVWYGDFSIDREHFIVLKGSFERFNVKAL